jgi:hypothetical protein
VACLGVLFEGAGVGLDDLIEAAWGGAGEPVFSPNEEKALGVRPWRWISQGADVSG